MGRMIFKYSIVVLILVSIMLIIGSQKSKLPQFIPDIFFVIIGCGMLISLIMFILKIIKFKQG